MLKKVEGWLGERTTWVGIAITLIAVLQLFDVSQDDILVVEAALAGFGLFTPDRIVGRK